MSFFKKIKAKLGYGSATIKASLTKDDYYPGDTIEGKVHIKGGEIPQEIDGVTIFLTTQVKDVLDNEEYLKDIDFFTYKIENFEPFTIVKGDEKEVYFSFTSPMTLPVSSDKTMVWFRAELSIKNGFDFEDRDYVLVKKHPLIDKLTEKFKEKGHLLKGIMNEKEENAPSNVLQLFEYEVEESYKEYIKRMEVFFIIDDKKINTFLIFNRNKYRLLKDSYVLDKEKPSFSIRKELIDSENIEEMIDKELKNEIEERKTN